MHPLNIRSPLTKDSLPDLRLTSADLPSNAQTDLQPRLRFIASHSVIDPLVVPKLLQHASKKYCGEHNYGGAWCVRSGNLYTSVVF